MEKTIKFTSEHFARMKELLIKALLEDKTFYSKVGTSMGVGELLHQTSINLLNEMKVALQNKISKFEAQDEWVDVEDDKLASLRESRELINLIIGYKRFQLQEQKREEELASLKNKLSKIEEDAKTPEQKMAELKAAIEQLTVK